MLLGTIIFKAHLLPLEGGSVFAVSTQSRAVLLLAAFASVSPD